MNFKKWQWFLLLCCGIFISLFIFRKELLRSSAEFLIVDSVDKQNSLPTFILAGAAKERAFKALKMNRKGLVSEFICTGGNLHYISSLIDSNIFEPEITRKALLVEGVSESKIQILHGGTSTMEEAQFIVDYCNKQNWKTVNIVTSAFHTRRCSLSFQKLNTDINFCFAPANSTIFNASNWWKSEEGLINWNNEWLKILYYGYKY